MWMHTKEETIVVLGLGRRNLTGPLLGEDIPSSSRGFIDLENFEGIKASTSSLGVKSWRKFWKEVSLVAIRASYAIWSSRYYWS